MSTSARDGVIRRESITDETGDTITVAIIPPDSGAGRDATVLLEVTDQVNRLALERTGLSPALAQAFTTSRLILAPAAARRLHQVIDEAAAEARGMDVAAAIRPVGDDVVFDDPAYPEEAADVARARQRRASRPAEEDAEGAR